MPYRNTINLTSMDFENIKESLIEFFKTQSDFTDYNFEGSGLNILLDALAYNTQNKAYLANMLANEMFLDSSILRSNVVSNAKSLGYTPKSMTASRAVISMTISDPGNTALSLLLPRGTKFRAGNASSQFTFVTLQDYNLYLDPETGLYYNSEIELFEGTIRTFSWDVVQEGRYIIPSTNIDTNTMKLVVYDSPTASSFEVFERVEGIRDVSNTTPVYWVSETDGRKFELKFGDNVFGKRPQVGNWIYAEYLTTSGVEANSLSKFSLAGSFAGYENADISISTVGPSAGGAKFESIESIKINAPRKFASKGKAVTPEDYKGIIAEIYPYTKAVEVWGGEDVTPVQYGKVFISIIPQSVSRLTSANKEFILRKLKSKKVAGIQPVIVDPTFTGINMTVNVSVKRNYLDNVPNFSNQIRTLVEEYFNNNFGVFDRAFYYTNLTTMIENFSRAVVSCGLRYTLSQVGSVMTKEYAFFNEIDPGSVRTNKILLLGDNEYVVAEDDGNGKLMAGSRQVGTVDYFTGTVTIDNTVFSSSFASPVEVFVEPANDDIAPGFSNTLTLNEKRLSIQMKAV